MANKLVKRTVTEEVFEAADVDPEIDADEDEVGEVEDDDADEEDSPRRRKRR